MAASADEGVLIGADRARAARDAAAALSSLDDDALSSRARAFVGFDGFIDSICAVVGQRSGPRPDDATPLTSMRDFAQRIGDASGKSANVELLVRRVKIGGNGPILALALASLGARVRCVGAFTRVIDGEDLGVDPVFADLVERCEQVVSLGEPGRTDALEFHDGKIMLGKLEPLASIHWRRVLDAAGGADPLRAMLADARVIASANWTMLFGMASIWEGLTRDILPRLPADSPRFVFVDLADPAKRSDADVARATQQLQAMRAVAPVVLGVNASEARRVASLVGARIDEPPENAGALDHAGFALAASRSLRAALGLSQVVVHTPHAAGACDDAGAAALTTAHTRRPVISTGAGDHFNAGYCLGLSLEMPAAQRLALGAGVSGWYVRHAASPARSDLADFLRDLPEPQSGG